MKYCTNCGNKLIDNSLYCGNCGKPINVNNNIDNNINNDNKILSIDPDNSNSEFNKKKSSNLSVIIVAIAFFIIILSVVFSGDIVEDDLIKNGTDRKSNLNSAESYFTNLGYTCKNDICTKTEESSGIKYTMSANIKSKTLCYENDNTYILYDYLADETIYEYNSYIVKYKIKIKYIGDIPNSSLESCSASNNDYCESNSSIISTAEYTSSLLRKIWIMAEEKNKQKNY